MISLALSFEPSTLSHFIPFVLSIEHSAMLNTFIKFLLIFLIIFTPLFFGSVELWAFSLMELGILLIIILGVLQNLFTPNSLLKTQNFKLQAPNSELLTPNSSLKNPLSAISHQPSVLALILLSFFLCFLLFQILPLPPGIAKILSPKTYDLHHQLDLSALSLEHSALSYSLSFFPYVTQVEFFKWLTLGVSSSFFSDGND